MDRNIVTLEAEYTSSVYATKCNTKEFGEGCPIKFFKCPFDEKPCEEIEAEDWEKVFKKEEVPFKKGELVAVRDTDKELYRIYVFYGYNDIDCGPYKYKVYRNIKEFKDSDTLNFIQCEKLSVFSKKFFFE